MSHSDPIPFADHDKINPSGFNVRFEISRGTLTGFLDAKEGQGVSNDHDKQGSAFKVNPSPWGERSRRGWTAKPARRPARSIVISSRIASHTQTDVRLTEGKKPVAMLKPKTISIQARTLRTRRFVRPGLETRSSKEFLRMGQLTEGEFSNLRRLAKDFHKDIVLSGSYAETDIGLRRRYDLLKVKDLGWRGHKPFSDLVDGGRGDLDIWEGTGLTQRELDRISETMCGLDIDIMGYNLERYPSLESFGDVNVGPGALVFRSPGAVERILGAWQR